MAELGCSELVQHIQSLAGQLAELHAAAGQPAMPQGTLPEPGSLLRTSTLMTATLPHAAILGIVLADCCFNLMQARTAGKALQAKERARLAEVHAVEMQTNQCTTALKSLEQNVEDVVFHLASVRQTLAPQGREAGLDQQPAEAQRAIARQLLGAIGQGDVERVRTGLREMLSLPPLLMPSGRKLARLIPAQGGPLEFFGPYRCGPLKPLEQRQYEALVACVAEVTSADCFSPSEQVQLASKLKTVFRDAMANDNPAVAACMLLGVQECSANPEVKHFFLANIGEPWHGGLAGSVDFLSEMLRRYSRRAPEWIAGMLERLAVVRTAAPRTS
ncbi:MAG: hypothetical protein H7332_15925 [Bdellovibrionales bacterium]|nr:hypothetical protein [Ramlibacter sp.]